MTFPHDFWTKPYSYQMGYISGTWKPSERDKKPPEGNPCEKDTKAWHEWEAGFEAGQLATEEQK